MAKNIFHFSSFFDVSDFPYKDLFNKSKNIWETVSQIAPYLNYLFAEGKLKANYADKVFIAEGAFIDVGARIDGPALILKGAKIGFNAHIHNDVIIASNAVVGNGSEIKNSIMLDTCKASHFNYVSDSILGNQVRLGVGSVIANKRVDRKNVTIKLPDGSRVDTGSTRFGTIIGDRSRIGANSVINPGTIIGKHCLVYPLTSVTGVHKDGEIIK